MNCKICKIQKIYSVEVKHKITRRKAFLCFNCWGRTKKYKLSKYSKNNYKFLVNQITVEK